ncbi:RHOMBOID-like protein 3 [Henckelia pumila]|uniref:RHOMBOID-like protein 3 n=1 Tax=Henckelia pumila TaxID=405737 RepID=UPI003C6E0CF2
MEREDVEGGGDKGVHSSAGRSNWVSWLIPIFVLINIAAFVVEMYVNNCPKRLRDREYSFGVDDGNCVARFLGRFSFQPLGENPLFGPSSSALDKIGALNWAKVVHQNQSWRLISCIWLHAGLIHLLVNMLCLVVIGIRLEQQFGFVRIGVIYLLSGVGGSILSSLFIQNRISVGASGALFGLLGAMLSELISNWSIYSNKVAALVTLVVIVVINLGLGILPHVNNFAHIGGFLTGFLLGFILLPRPQLGWIGRDNLPTHARPRSKYKASQYVLGLLALILVISGFTVGLVMLFRGENLYNRCHWCRYANCVPTSKWKCDE